MTRLDGVISVSYARSTLYAGEFMWIALSLFSVGGLVVAAIGFIVIGHRKLDAVLASFGCGIAHD